jgi:hypothetical protein
MNVLGFKHIELAEDITDVIMDTPANPKVYTRRAWANETSRMSNGIIK